MQSTYKGRVIEAHQSDVVLPSAMGGETDSGEFSVMVDGQDVTNRVSDSGAGLNAALERTRELIDSGEL